MLFINQSFLVEDARFWTNPTFRRGVASTTVDEGRSMSAIVWHCRPMYVRSSPADGDSPALLVEGR